MPIRRIGYIILFLIFISVSSSFILLNHQTVTVNYYFGQRDISLALLVLITLSIGVCLGFVAAGRYLIRRRIETNKLRKKITLVEQEIQNLREIPIKGEH